MSAEIFAEISNKIEEKQWFLDQLDVTLSMVVEPRKKESVSKAIRETFLIIKQEKVKLEKLRSDYPEDYILWKMMRGK